MRPNTTILSIIAVCLVAACGGRERMQTPSGPDADADGHTAPTRFTQEANAAIVKDLPLDDRQDFEDATRGRIAGDDPVVIKNESGETIWDTGAYAFIDGAPPPTVNPSLWRQAKLDNLHGLFEVTKGIYQVRGYDVSNMTLIEGSTGWIVVDPLTAAETAASAFELVRRHFGERPIAAVIFSHSHVDHFGGILGVLSAEEAVKRSVRIIAPKGFLEEATSENVLAGIAMGRRASFMYGMELARSARGHVDSGLGKVPARGKIGILTPTDLVDRTPQEMDVDGVRMVFQYAPESEAPAELTFYLPDRKAFCTAELATHVMHNLYTLRGAKVRDALRWSGYIDEAIDLFGDVEVVFASHNWPMWGNQRVRDYLAKQRDLYRFIHDQTLRLANAGETPQEIAETIELPQSLRRPFANRGYYGTLRHNAKAVYQWYFGWYDGNPANLDPLPPAEAARKYVEFMGGAPEVLRKSREAFERGEYRWVATVLNHLVFAEPQNAEARALLARAYDQLGYRAESAPWRDVYLTGARELRHGTPPAGLRLATAIELLRRMPTDKFFDAMAVRLNGPKAEGKTMRLNFVFTDTRETHVLVLDNAVLHHKRREPDPRATVTVRLTKDFLARLAAGQAGLKEMIFSNDLDVDGSRLDLLGFFRLLDTPTGAFNVVTP
jgi:alkyl sulfatase BDS1-like metallo-beta-lactamase superfamily hydrolase